MKIVADENILALEEQFRAYGTLVKRPGRAISRRDVQDADALLIRSITPVDSSLLQDSSVSFVASATSGTNHLDLDWLNQSGITVASAPGSNANAVVEYVLGALSDLVRHHNYVLQGKKIAVIGAGQVGGRLLTRLDALGFECLACDPFVARNGNMQLTRELVFRSLQEVICQADIISLHVPLTDKGPHPTRHLLDAAAIASLRPGTVLINTSRGEVVDTKALLDRLQRENNLKLVLDVWEGEPEPNRALLKLAHIVTPHIAGYSVEAKQAATAQVLAQFRRHFRLDDITANPASSRKIRAEKSKRLWLDLELILTAVLEDNATAEQVMAACLSAAFSPAAVAADYRRQLAVKPASGTAIFDTMRKKLAGRHEYSAYQVDKRLVQQGLLPEDVARSLQYLGFLFNGRRPGALGG